VIKAEILEALPKLNAEERREIRAKLNELESETWFDNGELSEQENAIIEARLDEYDRNPEVGSSWEEAKAHFGRTACRMTYRLRIRLAAEADVTEAAQWYNKRQLGLGEKFLREVDQAIVRILENPLAFPIILRRMKSDAY
jgi:hypothetical protein